MFCCVASARRRVVIEQPNLMRQLGKRVVADSPRRSRLCDICSSIADYLIQRHQPLLNKYRTAWLAHKLSFRPCQLYKRHSVAWILRKVC